MKLTTLDEYLARLDPDERAEIERGAAILIRESQNRRAVRESVVQAQAEVAGRLGIDQAAVARLQRRADKYVKTLRAVVKAMGGEMDLVVRFPDKAPVRIVQFRDTEVWPARDRGKKKPLGIATVDEGKTGVEGPGIEPSKGVEVPGIVL